MNDIYRFISDQPFDSDQYIDEICTYVAEDLKSYLEKSYKWKFGDELPEYPDEDFWDLFRPYEKKESLTLTREDILTFFRSDTFHELLDEHDREEIILACAHNERHEELLDQANQHWLNEVIQ